MSKSSPAAERPSRASGNAGQAYHAYERIKSGSSGIGVASPAVILMVEDSEDLRACVAQYLRIVGFEVIETENAGQALAAIDTGMHIDLLFSDVSMPGVMDGAALAGWVAVNRPALPVILTSGQPCPDLERAGPHRRFMRKPYSLDVLEHDVRELVGTTLIQ